MRKFFIPVLAAAVMAIPAGPAAAETVTTVVSFADLDIATPEGRSILEQRIADAVTEVCGRPARRSALVTDTIGRCRADAFEDAKAQLEAHLAAMPVEIAAVD